MGNKKLTNAQINQTKAYIDLYKWLSRAMASEDWNNVYVPYFKSKAAYQDVLNTYVGFKKEFEKATKNLSIDYTSKTPMTDDQLSAVHTAIGKMGDKGDIGKINLLLGRTFGESAGRYEALLTAMTIEARIDKKEVELQKVMAENETLKKVNNATDPEVLTRMMELKSLYGMMNDNLAVVQKQLADNGSRSTKAINSVKEAIMNQISGLYRQYDSFDAQFDKIAGIVRDAEHGIGHGIGVSIAETREVGRKVDELGLKIDANNKKNKAVRVGATVLAGVALVGAGMGINEMIRGDKNANINTAYIQEINRLNGIIKELQDKLASSVSPEEYEKISKDLEKAQKAYDEYVASHSASNDEVNAQLGALTLQIEELKEQIKGLGDPTVIANLQEQIKKLQGEYDTYKADHTFSNEDYNKIVAERDQAKKKFEEYKKTHSNTDAEYQAKVDRIAELEQEMANYKVSHKYSDSEYQEKVDKIAELEALMKTMVSGEQYDDAVKTLEALKKGFENYKESHQYSNTEYQAKVDRIAELEAQISTMVPGKKYDEAVAAKKQAEKDLQDYMESHTYVNDEVEQMKKDYQAEIADLKEKLANAKTQEEVDAIVGKYQNFITELGNKLSYGAGMTEDETMSYIANMFGVNYEESTKGAEQDANQRGE